MIMQNEQPARRITSILISSAAALLALIHVVYPSLSIDGITLILIALAILPWLAPVFKAIELPGGWKFEFQELKRKVEAKGGEVTELNKRVKSVEQIVFSGQTTSTFVSEATKALVNLHNYFNDLGAEIGSNYPMFMLKVNHL